MVDQVDELRVLNLALLIDLREEIDVPENTRKLFIMFLKGS
jgi:hypothetical protein